MPDYIQDPNDPKKQIPGPRPANIKDRTVAPASCKLHKTPNYVLITTTMTKPFGFFYGDSASFASLATTEGNKNSQLSGSQHYDVNWGLVPAGTRLDIHPTAWSGSADDAGRVRFIYKGGLDGQGRG
jgi:hypothetical protein